MVDLGSVLAIVGLSIQLLNTLAKSLATGHEKIRETRECRDRLRSFSFRLQDGLGQLEEWLMRWNMDRPYHDTFYRNLWGEEGLHSIWQRRERIEQLAGKIEQLLCQYPNAGGPHELSGQDLDDWRRVHGSRIFQSPFVRGPADPKVRLWRRVGFSLFDNARLKEYVDSFMVEVRELDQFSRRKLRLRQKRDASVPVTLEEVRDLAQLIVLLDSAFEFGNVTWDYFSNQQLFHAALEVNGPGADQTLDQWREWDQLYHEYFVRSQTSAKGCRLRIEVGRQVSDVRKSLQGLAAEVETLFGRPGSNTSGTGCRRSWIEIHALPRYGTG